MPTSSWDGPEQGSPKPSSPSDRESLGQQSHESSAAPPATSGSMSFSDSPTHSDRPSQTSSFRRALHQWTTTNSLGVPPPPILSSSQPVISLMPSPRRPAKIFRDTVAPVALWAVSFHPKVAKIIAVNGGLDSPAFRPRIAELVIALARNPKRFPKKHGKLKEARAAEAHFADGVTWRAVFIVNEEARTVRVIGLGPHDVAYRDAEDRI